MREGRAAATGCVREGKGLRVKIEMGERIARGKVKYLKHVETSSFITLLKETVSIS